MLRLIILIIVIIIGVIIIKNYKKLRIDVITLYTGGLGSGKTYNSFANVIRILRKIYFLNFRFKNEQYVIYSTIPFGKIDENGNHFIKIFYHKIYVYNLNKRILLLQERLPQNKVILVIDEISQFCSQFDYKNENILGSINEFFRLFRHYTNGKGYIFCNDQCSQNIIWCVRRRINYTYNMLSTIKVKLLPIWISEYRKILISDEVKSVLDVKDSTNEDEIKKCIYFNKVHKLYDTCCYSNRYYAIKDLFNNEQFTEKYKKNKLESIPDKYLYYETLKYDEKIENPLKKD